MAKFDIISKNGESVRLSGCPKYTGTFLGVSFLEFSSIESPVLIDWEIGDYIDYERTGLRYKLYSLPIPKKQARGGSYGASFVYPNVKFYAETKDLEIAPFRDIVPEDNNIHFSTRPEVSTYENVYGLARRIQACMDDVFPGKWRIEVYDTDDTKLIETLNETKDFSISNSNCLQTLSQIYEKWDNIGWIHSYDSAQNVHVITIGRASVRDNENTSDVFAYGLGNGLTSIKKASSNEDEFATRLYIYGSDRNIQTRYYKEFDILNAESVDIRNLMLPISTWGKTDGLPDARKAYLEADQSIIEKYGLIPRTVYFDGSQNEAIYPSIQGLKMSQVREEMIAAGHEDSKHLPPNENIRIDKTGYIIISLNSMIFDLGDGSKADVESNPTFLLSLPAVGFDIAEQGTLTSEGLATISMKSGPCAGREFKVKSYWGYTNQLPNGYHAYEVYRNWDESLGLGFPNKTYKINEGDEYVLLDIPMPDYYITLAEKRLLEAGQKKLAECTKVSPYYEPAIDPIKIKESGKALREGMYMQISDPDIIDTEDGKDYVLIDTLTIDEKAELPKYNITLRKQKRLSKSFASLESRIGASEKSLSTLTTDKAGKSDIYNQLRKYVLLEAPSQTIKGDFIIDGNLVIKGDAFSYGQFAAAAVGAEGGGSVGATYLSDLYDVSLGSLLSGDILSWNGSEWVNIKQSSLVPDLSGYATQSDVTSALSNYLPKTGGVIESSLAAPLEINSTSQSEVGVAYRMSGTYKGWIGYNPTYGAILYNYPSNAYLGIRDNGKAYVNDSEIYHTGNFNPANYLPLSGGTIEGGSGIYTPLTIKNTSLSEVWIGFQDAHGTCYIGSSNGVPSVNMGADNKTLIHSGNIGSQSVAYADSAGVLKIKTEQDPDTAEKGQMFSTLANQGIPEGGSTYLNGLTFATNNDSSYKVQLGIDYNGAMFTRSQKGWIWGDWKNIAFTDSNVASAQALTHSNGNVAVIAGENKTLRLQGAITSADNALQLLDFNTDGLWLGYSMRNSYPTFLYGNTLYLRTGESNRLVINPSGNVTIGDSDYAGTTYKMSVDGKVHIRSTAGASMNEGAGSLIVGNGTVLMIDANDIQAKTNGTTAGPLYINDWGGNVILCGQNNGNVLIGTTTDRGYKCSIASSKATTLSLHRTSSGGGSFIDFFANNETENQWRVGHDYNVSGSSFVFNKFDSATEKTLMRINASGAYTLDVNGILRATAANFGGDVGINIGMTYADNTSGAYDLIERKKSGYPLYFQYNHNGHLFMCQGGGNVIIGTTADNGAKTQIVDSTKNSINGINIASSSLMALSSINSQNDGLFFGHYLSVGWIQSAFYGTEANPSRNHTYAISLNPLGGNVLVGTTTDSGEKLQVAGDVRIGAPNLPSNLVVNGNTRICRRYDDRTYLDIICEDVFVNYEAYDTDGFCSHVFKSNGSDILTLYGFDNSATFWGSVLVSDTLTAQNGIVTNEITIGGIKLDVVNGALRVNGDIFSTGQFAASVAGEATGGSNIVLDYASIVNALGYTPANNNNLAQVAFTGSYSSLSGTPDVYTKADVYNKNEINQKLAGVGGGGGSVGSTFGIDYINGQSFDMPNGVNCITSYSEATVNFSSVVPADPSLPCIVYIVKCDYHTLQVTLGCNIVSVNSSGDEVSDFSINGMTGMMLVWDPDIWRWVAYLQK